MSEGPFVLYKELLPATSLLAAEYFQCYHHHQGQYYQYLCTLSSSILSIYRVDQVLSEDSLLEEGSGGTKSSLTLVRYERIYGRCRDIKAFHRGNKFHDLLVIAIDEGKVIGFEYLPEENMLHESIICNVEDNAYGVGAEIQTSVNSKQIYFGTGSEPIIRISQEYGIVAAVIYGEEIFFGSFPTTHGNDWKANNIIQHRLLCNIMKYLNQTGPILDMCYVTGYGRPTIAILQEETLLPVGHVSKVHSNCVLSVYAIDVEQKSMALLWKQAKLPHDSLCLIQINAKALSYHVAVVSQNAVLLVGEESVQVLPTNGFASMTVRRKGVEFIPWATAEKGYELDASFWTEFPLFDEKGQVKENETSMLGFLRDGSILQIHVSAVMKSIASSLGIEAAVIGETVKPSCCCSSSVINGNSQQRLVFVGARSGNCMLLNATPLVASLGLQRQSGHQESIDIYHDVFQEFTFIDGNHQALVAHSPVDVQDLVLREEEDLYTKKGILLGESSILQQGLQSFSVHSKNWMIKLSDVDAIDLLGPVLHGFVTKMDDNFSQMTKVDWDRSSAAKQMKQMQTVATYIAERETKDALVVASGLDEDASLHRVMSGVGVAKVTTRNFPGATKLFTSSLSFFAILLVAYDNKTRVLNCKEDNLNTSTSSAHTPDLKFVELQGEDVGFVMNHTTIALGTVAQENIDNEHSVVLVQVTPYNIVVVSVEEGFGGGIVRKHEVSLMEAVSKGGLGGRSQEHIITADICHDYVVILTSLLNVYILHYNQQSKQLKPICYRESSKSKGIVLSASSAEALAAINSIAELSFLDADIVSVSLFHGKADFAQANGEVAVDEMALPEKGLSEVEKEELELYGTHIEEGDEVSDTAVVMSSTAPATVQKSSEDHFLLVTDIHGYLSIIRLSDFQCILKSDKFTQQAHSISVQGQHEVIDVEDSKSQNRRKLSDRYIIETRLCRLSFDHHNQDSSYDQETSPSQLCLLTLFHTGELLVYRGFEVASSNQEIDPIRSFQKVLTKTIHNKRFTINTTMTTVSTNKDTNMVVSNAANDISASEGSVANPFQRQMNNQNIDQYMDTITYLESEDFLFRSCSTLIPMHNVQGYFISDAILISANNPLILTLERGYPTLHNIDFPETPYINFGQHLIRPLQTSTFNYLSTMWYEFEDIESLRNPVNMKNRAQKQSTLGLYRILPRQTMSAYGGICRQSVGIEETVLKCQELLKLTDDKTEQALLEKKAFILLTSQPKYSAFNASVIEKVENIDNEDVIYERYFPNIESFAQPDASLAPVPMQVETEYKISIMQNGKVVDSYIVPTNERVLDMTVLYLTVEKHITTPGTTALTKVNERRVCVLVSTVYMDKRGEDTLGNGRLLLFGIDYAMFGGIDSTEESKQEGENEPKDGENAANGNDDNDEQQKKRPRLQEGQQEVQAASKPMEVDSKQASGLTAAQLQFFGSIKPKLRLLSTGPGPASVVAQIPYFGSKEGGFSNTGIGSNSSSTNTTNPWTNYVVATVGSTVFIYKYNPNTMELDQVTFYFAQVSDFFFCG